MLRRYFSLFHIPSLLIMLAIFYIMVLTSDKFNGVLENAGALTCITILILLWNTTAIENWKYVKTGNWIDLKESNLTEEERVLKEARLGKTNPLFVVVDNEYFYYDDNYKSSNVSGMTDLTEVLKKD